MSGEIIIGCFVKTTCCTECDWFCPPLLMSLTGLNGCSVPIITICPDCGANVAEMAGRYKINVTQSFFGNTNNEYIDFIRRETTIDVPTPAGAIQT